MSARKDVVFEINMASRTIVFHQSGPWADLLQLRINVAYNYTELLGRFARTYVDRDDRDAFLLISDIAALQEAFKRKAPLVSYDVRILVPQSSVYEWHHVSIVSPIGGKSYGTIQNMQREKEREQLLRHQAEHDSLTDLLNRKSFERAVSAATAPEGARGAFIIIDIDDFKGVNDSHGHQFGDDVLRQTADLLRERLPDGAVVGRFGGDEFVVYLPLACDGKGYDSVVSELSREMTFPGCDAPVTLSMGLSLYPEHGTAMSELLRRADQALYVVKAGGKNGYAVYDPSMPDINGSAENRRDADEGARRPRRPRKKRRWNRMAITVTAVLTVGLIVAANVILRTLRGMLPAAGLTASAWGPMLTGLVWCSLAALAMLLIQTALLLVQTRARERLEKRLYTDRITGGATRERFDLDLADALASGDVRYAIVYANVERFHIIVERYGEEEANEALRFLHAVLQKDLAPNETAARLYSDRFVVLLATQDPLAIERRVRGWSHDIRLRSSFEEGMYPLTLSYGVYPIDDPSLPSDVLISLANTARKGNLGSFVEGARLSFYDERLKEGMRNERAFEERMEDALANREFLLYLQPKYDAKTNAIAGFEALVRWSGEGGELLYPGQFVPLFERNGFIVKLDLYVFEQICAAQSRLIARGIAPRRVSFNVSRVHLLSEKPVEHYIDIWKRYSVPPEYLEFEFTESTIYDNAERLSQVVGQLRVHGFKCSMDDFGSGYSSLNMLRDTNVDILKIGRSFLGEGESPSERSRKIIRSVVALAHELGLQTVAEGVEYREQADFLRDSGCDVLQGYYCARPMPAGEAFALLESGEASGPDDTTA